MRRTWPFGEFLQRKQETVAQLTTFSLSPPLSLSHTHTHKTAGFAHFGSALCLSVCLSTRLSASPSMRHYEPAFVDTNSTALSPLGIPVLYDADELTCSSSRHRPTPHVTAKHVTSPPDTTRHRPTRHGTARYVTAQPDTSRHRPTRHIRALLVYKYV